MLTLEQITARRYKLTASKVGILANGDAEQINQLYLEMIGEATEEDLSDVWPVQLGAWTEPLQLEWYERKSGHILTRKGAVVVHPKVPWAAATLDAWIDELKCPLEVKHTGGRETWETIVDRYAPQRTWQMLATGAEQCGFSVIMGAAEPRVDFFQYNADYGNKLFTLARVFMRHVAARTPPVELAPRLDPPAYDERKNYDMAGNNEWGNHADIWKNNRNGFRACQQAEIELKKLVPVDARTCVGNGVSISIDRGNRKHIREVEQ